MSLRREASERRKLKLEEQERRAREYDAKERLMLASWSDERLRQAVASVEAGGRDEEEGREAIGWEQPGLVEVFELRFLREELERRGWPPFREGPYRVRRGVG